ncbi:TM0106 family RecB-like putative nuclease, partial [Microcoleus sp. PH2017_05_CCC_O_A]
DLLASYPEFVAGVAVDVVQQARSTLLNQPFVREAGSSATDFVTDLTDVKEGSSAADYVTNLTDVKDRGSATTAVNQFIRIPEVAGNSLVIAKIESVKITENKSAAPSIPAPILRKKPIPYSQSVFLPIAPIELYFDIEAEPELNLDYLHGVLVVDRYNNTEKFHGFLAESPAEEGAIWEQFLELMWAYPIAPIFHFCDYEVKTFKRLAKLYNTPAYLWKPVLKRFVDIHKQVTQQAIMPVESYALKPIARWLGFDWRDAKANGAQCVCWYDDWLKTGDRDLLEAIVRYNEDDCRATYIVKDWLTNFLLSQKQ